MHWDCSNRKKQIPPSMDLSYIQGLFLLKINIQSLFSFGSVICLLILCKFLSSLLSSIHDLNLVEEWTPDSSKSDKKVKDIYSGFEHSNYRKQLVLWFRLHFDILSDFRRTSWPTSNYISETWVYCLKLKVKRNAFFKRSVTYLCHLMRKESVATDLENIKAIIIWPVPYNIRTLIFFGFVG